MAALVEPSPVSHGGPRAPAACSLQGEPGRAGAGRPRGGKGEGRPEGRGGTEGEGRPPESLAAAAASARFGIDLGIG